MRFVRHFLVLAAIFAAPVSAVSAQDFANKLDEFIPKAMDLKIAPGVVVAVVKDGEVRYLKGFGQADVEANRPVDPDTVFYIASSTKSFTGLAAALLHLREEISLDASLADYLPNAKLDEALDAESITLKELLTHTHGIDNNGPVAFRAAYTGEFTNELLVDLLSKHGPQEDGKTFRYGNIGYNVATLAMDAKLQKGWKHVLADEIFGPLGMKSTTGFVSQVAADRLAMPYRLTGDGFGQLHYGKTDNNMHSAGGLVTTGRDITRWLLANTQQGKVDGEQALPAKAFELAHEPYATQTGQYMSFGRTGYGLGWNTGTYDGDKFWHHFGGFSGFHSHISFMPEHNIGVAVFANTTQGGFVADLIARYAYDNLLEKADVDAKFADQLEQFEQQIANGRQSIAADLARRQARSQELSKPLTAYAGEYRNADYGLVTFKVVEGKLKMEMGAINSDVEVYDAERDALRVEVGGSGNVAFFHFENGDHASSITVLDESFERVENSP